MVAGLPFIFVAWPCRPVRRTGGFARCAFGVRVKPLQHGSGPRRPAALAPAEAGAMQPPRAPYVHDVLAATDVAGPHLCPGSPVPHRYVAPDTPGEEFDNVVDTVDPARLMQEPPCSPPSSSQRFFRAVSLSHRWSAVSWRALQAVR